jgi:probable phosphoglycerate mutase
VTRLLVIRHAATDWNEAGLIQGRTDRPLSSAGRAWASRTRVPAGWDGALCLSSPLVRAMETARLLRLAPSPEPRLIEMAWGEWEGRRLTDLRAELGGAMTDNEKRGLDFRPPRGESPRDVQERVKPLLFGRAGPAVFITHKGVLRALYALATGWDLKAKAPDKLAAGCAHSFRLGPEGMIAVDRLNIPLEPAT